jgi:hypothetical protein
LKYSNFSRIAVIINKIFLLCIKSGVFTAACGTNLDHGVLVVGYGIEMDSEYYLVKNSWGEHWGKNGYIMLGKGKDPNTNKPYNNGSGQCGILLQASYPVL